MVKQKLLLQPKLGLKLGEAGRAPIHEMLFRKTALVITCDKGSKLYTEFLNYIEIIKRDVDKIKLHL